MNFYYNGADIYDSVSVNYCVHEMYAEKQADTLVIRFNDTKGVWSKWQPAAGDTVRFKEGASDTGKMFIHSMKPENGLFTIRAMSMPKTGKIRKSKSWEGVRFLQLANEFAAGHGLDFKNYGCEDQLYPYIQQVSIHAPARGATAGHTANRFFIVERLEVIKRRPDRFFQVCHVHVSRH